jgi:hypothetical protein
VNSVQQVLVAWLQTPPGQVPQTTIPLQPSSNVPHWNVEKSAHVFGAHGAPQTPLALQTWPIGH